MAELLTTKQVADKLKVEQWQVRRLYEEGTLPEPSRVCGYRVIDPNELPTIKAALKKRGFLKPKSRSKS